MFRRKSSRPSRAQLIDKKHQLEGEIRMLSGEVRRLRARGADVASQESRLERLRSEHHQTRLAIDRAERE